MITVPEDIKQIYYSDVSKKRLVLSTNPDWIYDEDVEYQKDVNTLNLFNGNAYLNNTPWRMPYLINPFSSSSWFHVKINRYSNMDSYDATNAVKTFAFKYRNYVNISMNIGIYNTSTPYPRQIQFGAVYIDNTGAEREKCITFNVSDYLASSDWEMVGRISITIPTYKFSAVGASGIKRIEFKGVDGNADFYGYFIYGQPIISVSDNIDDFPIAYHEDDYSEINLTEYIPFMIFDNNDIEYESFSLTESLCSKDNIEFGLCEAANCEVTLINDTHVVKDEVLYIQLAVDSPNLEDVSYSSIKRINWYKGTINNYRPSSVTYRQWDNVTGYRFYTDAYGKVNISNYSNYFSQNNYIFVRFKFRIESFTTNGTRPTYVRPDMGFSRGGDTSWWIRYNITTLRLDDLLSDEYTDIIFKVRYISSDLPIDEILRFGFALYDENSEQLNITYSVKCWFTEFQVCSVREYSESLLDFNINNCYVYNNTLNEYLAAHNEYSIPLGKFNVKDVQNNISYDLVRKQLTMYDDMILLEQNAANWYTRYMYGISTDSASKYGFEFARQIYSSYFNYMKSIGIMQVPDDDDMTKVLERTHDQLVNSMSTKTYTFYATVNEDHTTIYNSSKLYYSKTAVNNPDSQKIYLVKWFNYQLRDSIEIPYYRDRHDNQNRGLETCNILIEEELSDGTYNRFAVDSDDFFALSSNVIQFNIYVPVYGVTNVESGGTRYEIIDHFELYNIDNTFDLENASKRLLYYNYDFNEEYVDEEIDTDTWIHYNKYISHIIFECDSNITGRDVVHSLLELTGCFFRMNRKTGKPEFIYCTKSGLYPSNTLYPADDLYPRRGTDQVASMGKYISTEYADYTVTRFGKIQILKNQTSNDAESNVQWQYSGDEDVGLNTYIIDDNIFYCNKDMTYDTEHMQELDKVLEKMYYRISNMDYVPNTTEALGMPWVECGDRVGLLTAIGGFETFIYRRMLKGIQGLFDTYESRGDEYNNAINNYGY